MTVKNVIILLLGGNGQLGFELFRSLAVLGRVFTADRRHCDLANSESVKVLLKQLNPDIIVNAAAYTAVDKAETEPELAYAVNSDAPQVLATWAAENAALLVHYSTDYVFDGELDRPYCEDDAASPLSVYGCSKLAGEQIIRSSGCRHLIIRTSWLYGVYGHNFLKKMLRLMREETSFNIVSDQFGAPTAASLVADCTAQILANYLRDFSHDSMPYGTYHLAAGGETNWFCYAMKILEFSKLHGLAVKCSAELIKPVKSCEYPSIIRRPLNSRLSIQRLQNTFDIQLPDWQSGVEQAIRMLSQGRFLDTK